MEVSASIFTLAQEGECPLDRSTHLRVGALDIPDATPADIERVAEAAVLPGSPTHDVPVELTVPPVRDAILAHDAFTAATAKERFDLFCDLVAHSR